MNVKRIILAVIVLAAVVLVSIAIFSIDWGGNNSGTYPEKPVINIADYANTDVQVQMAVRGPINADQSHQDMSITVGRSQTVGELFTGYQNAVTRQESTPNNETSYRAFLSALHNAGFTGMQPAPRGVQYDGACAKGYRYTFTFIGNGSSVPPSSWTTSCGSRYGTFAGDFSTVKTLFNAQLPKAQLNALTNNTQF